jgi:Protein of unknown function (DUF1350)
VFMAARPTWERVAGCDVLLPAGTKTPKAVVHFAGGLGAGAAPKTLYSTFLERVVERGDVAVIATPVGAGFDHDAIAREVAELNGSVLVALLARWGMSWIPVVCSQDRVAFCSRHSSRLHARWTNYVSAVSNFHRY